MLGGGAPGVLQPQPNRHRTTAFTPHLAGAQFQAIRQALAANLVAVCFQKLLPALNPKIKRVPCVEVMLNSPAVKKYILEEREHELLSVIRNERGTGMIDFNEMLAELVLGETVSLKEAMLASPNPDELRMRLKGIRTST